MMQGRLSLDVLIQVFSGDCEVTFSLCLPLRALGNALACFCQLLLPISDLVLDGLLQHFEIVRVSSLGLPQLLQLSLRLLVKVLQGVENVPTMTFVHRASG